LTFWRGRLAVLAFDLLADGLAQPLDRFQPEPLGEVVVEL
jgi:hypothetical protein